jgi:hypothetical protein
MKFIAGEPMKPATKEMLQAQSERHVFRHRHVRIQRIVLEHHGDIAMSAVDAAVAATNCRRESFLRDMAFRPPSRISLRWSLELTLRMAVNARARVRRLKRPDD